MITKTIFVCQACGFQSPKWLGKCPDCNEWNTMVEEVGMQQSGRGLKGSYQEVPRLLSEIEVGEESRLKTHIGELDRLLGGGIVPGSVILVGGDPGIGKSTLLLQASACLSEHSGCVLYVSGEESSKQTKLRADRLKHASSDNLYIINETNLDLISEHIKKLSPRVVIIDSIQIIYKLGLSSSPGSVSQVRECAGELTYLAKASGISMFLVGHVTKDGSIAGPKVLEHMVDTVLYFEGERHTSFRILRAVKNRFGSTNEIGIFQMTAEGLTEVSNPSEMFLSERLEDAPGSVVVPCIEGERPLLVEIQALVSPANFGMPRRWTSGLDYNRAILLIAVLEKRAGLALPNQDVFVNVAGGIKVSEPAADLGLAIAIASSLKDRAVKPYTVALGEVGLGGEVRGVTRLEPRIREAEKLGFKRSIVSQNNLEKSQLKTNMEIVGVRTINEALEAGL